MADETALELIVPRKRRHVIGAFVFTGIVIAPSILAVYNLVYWQAVISSTLWLSLVGLGVGSFCNEHGLKQAMIETLGTFSSQEFVRAHRNDSSTEIEWGYSIFGKRFTYITIPGGNISNVHWSSGQATHMAGRDMDDWSVVLWFDLPRIAVPAAKGRGRLRTGQDLRIIGESGLRAETAELGRAFIDFLHKAGVALVPTDDCTFIRPEPVHKP